LTTTHDCSAGVLRQWTSYNTSTSRQTDRQTTRYTVLLTKCTDLLQVNCRTLLLLSSV